MYGAPKRFRCWRSISTDIQFLKSSAVFALMSSEVGGAIPVAATVTLSLKTTRLGYKEFSTSLLAAKAGVTNLIFTGTTAIRQAMFTTPASPLPQISAEKTRPVVAHFDWFQRVVHGTSGFPL